MDSWDYDDESHGAVLTLWFLTTEDPASVLTTEPRADRGFGRKYLAQLNPAWPITPIGQFPLNRSTPASRGEFYVAGFPGVTIVQTARDSLEKLSEVAPSLLHSVKARDVYGFAVNEATGYGGLAHWHEGELKRSLCARPMELIEDRGVPEPFESPYWAGQKGEQLGGIYLPFRPLDLVAESQRVWLGVDISPEGPDINVVAYAVDGRPEPKVEPPPTNRLRSVGQIASAASARLGLGSGRGDYDDYEEHGEQTTTGTSAEFARIAGSAATAAKQVGKGLWRRARQTRATLADKLRHTDRP